MKSVVVFHANCPDGAFAAAVTLRALRARGESAELPLLVPAGYQRPLESIVSAKDVKGKNVYIVDFSFSPEDMTILSGMVENGNLITLDHHKSALERFEKAWGSRPLGPGLEEKTFTFNGACRYILVDMRSSGATLAWKHFYAEKEVPKLLAHVEDYDLWRHKFPDSRAVHAWIRSTGMGVEFLENLLNVLDLLPDNFADIVREGHVILNSNLQQAKALASNPERVTFGGLTALAVNAPLHQDEIGDMLAAQNPSGVGIMWYWRNGRYKVSLRSMSVNGREPFDCADFVSKLNPGAGGHKTSAALICKELPWRTKD